LPVGNDIVDLEHPHCQPEAIHPRFDTRAFTPREVSLIAQSPQVHRTRWSLWAAKESAFKACRKIDRQVRFLPRDFAVYLRGARAEVRHRLGRFDVWFDHSEQWVHALASQGSDRPGSQLGGDPAGNPNIREDDLSERARVLARSALGTALDLAPSELRIVSEDQIPQSSRHGKPLPVDLSLSHDGRFVSCAWQVIESYLERSVIDPVTWRR